MHGQIKVTQESAMSSVSSTNMSNDPAPSAVSMFSQYYSMPSGSAPKTHIIPPKNY